MFLDLGPSIARGTNTAMDWLVVHYGNAFEAFANSILVILVAIEQALSGTPPWVVLLAVGLLAYLAGRSLLGAGALVFLTWLLGCLGLWDQAMQTLAILLVAVTLAVAIGIPSGCYGAKRPPRGALQPLLDLMQTIPSFVYLIPAAMLFGLGKVPAIFATVVYATPPLVRLTDLGIREVDNEVVEASRAFGATRWQLLKGVQLPLALPVVMQGVNQATMMALAMVVIASMIGARGIGQTVLLGLQRNDSGTGLIGGLGIVILAIVLDRISQAFGRRLQAHRTVRN